jgi:hypothetical protein
MPSRSSARARARRVRRRRRRTESVVDPDSEIAPAVRRWPLRIFFGGAFAFIGIGCVAVAAYFGTPPTPRVGGRNLPVNAGAVDPRDTSAHNSPTIVRNPADPANLAISNRIDNPRFSCALHVSFDAGATWAQTAIPIPKGEEPKCFAPEAAFGAEGRLYIMFVTLHGSGNVPHAVWLSMSEDGGRTLSAPHRVLGPLSFQVRLVADPYVPGRLYLTWIDAEDTATLAFPETGYPVRFARSDDGGVTWRGPVRVSELARSRVVAPSLAVAPGGTLHVLYVDLKEDRLDYHGAHGGRGGPPYPGFWQLVATRSTDGGATWTASLVEDRLVPTERFIVFIPPYPSLAVDGEGGGIYASLHDRRLGDADVWLWASHDRGETFSGPTRVNDTAVHDGTSQYLPEVAVAPDGRVDVLYYDRRADQDDIFNEVSLQSSIDGGETFEPRVRVSDTAFSSRIGFGSERDMPDLGNRLALLSTGGRALAVWTDTRAGPPVAGKQDLVRGVVVFPTRPQLADPVESGLRYGGAALIPLGLALGVSGVISRRPHRNSVWHEDEPSSTASAPSAAAPGDLDER